MLEETTTPAATTTETTTTTPAPERVEIKDPEAVLKKNKELLAEVKRLSSLKQFEGLDFEEVAAALDVAKQKKEKQLIEKGDYENAKKLIREEESKRFTALEQEFNQFIQKNAYKALQAELTGSHEVRPEYADDVATILQAHFIQPTKKDGEIIWTNKDGIGDAADLGKIIADLKAKKPAYFNPNSTTGGGALGSNGTGGGTLKRSEMTPQQKSAFIKKNGQQAYLSLPN